MAGDVVKKGMAVRTQLFGESAAKAATEYMKQFDARNFQYENWTSHHG